MSFHALQVSCEKIRYTFEQEHDKLFRATLKEKSFAFVGKRMDYLESIETLCVHRPIFFIVSAGPVYKILRESIPCLYNNVIERLFVATSQRIDDRREQILRADTIKLDLIRVPIVD